MLDQAFDALKSYNWGTDLNALNPISDAVISSRGDEAARKELEARLATVLQTDVSRDAKDYVCRQLMLVGTATSVPILAELMPDKDQSHMARYALERIPAPEAAQAMRDSLPKITGALKVGVITSLGARRDAASVPMLAALIADTDISVARAAAFALGDVRTAEAVKALAGAKSASPEVKSAVTDARLACAERLLAEGKKGEALAVYKSLTGEDQSKLVRLAATRGMLACAGKKE